jgi:hypothetical protein
VKVRKRYSIEGSRKLLGGVSHNSIYGMLRTGELAIASSAAVGSFQTRRSLALTSLSVMGFARFGS